ncbi:hypothetical protein PWP93_11870 [Paraburkholderia sp. A1RI-2L]|uniref:hypothetical protein n=1 Tax=Paraburkholderia sp. A1RI-2L TaxID=3028367 RepID=UPI003B7AD287
MSAAIDTPVTTYRYGTHQNLNPEELFFYTAVEKGFNLFSILLLPFSKAQGKKYEKEALTVGMLERVIHLGVWDSQRLAG